jgi:uncharacterized membrane protein HdeD (DUF308 family)
MRVLVVLVLALVCAATIAVALAFGESVLTAGIASVASQNMTPSEPAAMLLSGSALLGLAGALKRLTF